MMFVRMCKAVASVIWKPSRLPFPIGTYHILPMLALPCMSRLEQRAVLIVGVSTVACSRVVEAVQIQKCDLQWDHDAACHASLRNAPSVS